MPSTTTKGVPFSLGTDTADTIDTTMQSLAEWVDARPGVSALTTAQRDALAVIDKWDGRIIQNMTTGRLERWSTGAAMWISASEKNPDIETITLRPPAASVGVKVILAAGATGDAIDVRNSALAALFRIDNAGAMILGNPALAPSAQAATVLGGVAYVGQGSAAPEYLQATMSVRPTSISTGGLTIKALSGQTGVLTEWRDNAGAVLSAVESTGKFSAARGLYVAGRTNDNSVFVLHTAPSQQAVIIRMAASQTAAALDVQDNAGNLLSGVGSTGQFLANRGIHVLRATSSTIGIQNGASHNSLVFDTYQDGSGYGHGLVSIGYTGSGRSIKIGSQSSADFSVSAMDPILTVYDSRVVEGRNEIRLADASGVTMGRWRAAGTGGQLDLVAASAVATPGLAGGALYAASATLRWRASNGSDYYITG